MKGSMEYEKEGVTSPCNVMEIGLHVIQIELPAKRKEQTYQWINLIHNDIKLLISEKTLNRRKKEKVNSLQQTP